MRANGAISGNTSEAGCIALHNFQCYERLVNDPYELLGVRRGAEPEVIDAAYRALMKKHHPDRSSGTADVGRAQQINAAYAAIKGRRTTPQAKEGTAASWEAPTVVLTPPLREGRNFARAVFVSIILLTILVKFVAN